MPAHTIDANQARKLAEFAQPGEAAIAHGLCAIAEAIMTLARVIGEKKDAS